MLIFERGEERVVLDPRGRVPQDLVVVLAKLGITLHTALEVMKRLFEDATLVLPGSLVIHTSRVERGRLVDVVPIQKAGQHEQLRADEIHVAGERRRRRIGRAAQPSGTERHDLPERLPRGGQEVDEPTRFSAEIADAERPRQRRGMQEDAARALEFHGLSDAVGSAVFTHARSTSATLHACATQPRGVYGSRASKTSLMLPMQASSRCGTKPWRNRSARAGSSGCNRRHTSQKGTIRMTQTIHW